jgi:flavin reductase (DIM6/NTAB) family NADH-FMN oxidoreductase RutF
VIDAHTMRQIMGCFPTGVTVVAARDAGGMPFGLTVNSLTSVSLDPPLVLVCIDCEASSHDRLISASSFTVSVLSGEQVTLARRFASEPSTGRFTGVDWQTVASGDPVLDGAVAWLSCARESVYGAGDHSIVLGRVEAGGASDAHALAFYRGNFVRMSP